MINSPISLYWACLYMPLTVVPTELRYVTVGVGFGIMNDMRTVWGCSWLVKTHYLPVITANMQALTLFMMLCL